MVSSLLCCKKVVYVLLCVSRQPLLDVDHTSARLNLLTPRYVNQKGVALPTSSAVTRRAKRENLQQKQILVPELCDVHPFPASLWRKAVCLPAMLYRINCLLIAEELRRSIAVEAHIGLVDGKLNGFDSCPPLRFGFCDISQSCAKLQEVSAMCQSSDNNAVDCELTDALVQTLEDIHVDADNAVSVHERLNFSNCDRDGNSCCSQSHSVDISCCTNAVCHNSNITTCGGTSDCTQLLLNGECVADLDKVDRIINSACRNCASHACCCCVMDKHTLDTDDISNSSECQTGVGVSEMHQEAEFQCCSFSLDADTSSSGGPSPCDVIQALTMSNANDFFNLERLETIGDSFLKFAISIYLYCMYPGIHEGKLSYLRSIQVYFYFFSVVAACR